MATVQKSWFGVKCLFEHKGLSKDPTARVYEERVVVVLATSFDEAIARAEEDAAAYGYEYLGYCNAFSIETDKIEDCSEVFSLMRETHLSPKEFIDRYCDDGTDRSA